MAGISSKIRDMTPCNGCTEKADYCHGRCQKDERGEFGYAAWREYMLKPYVRNYGK